MVQQHLFLLHMQKELADKIRADYGNEYEEGGQGMQPEVGGVGSPSQPRSIEVLVACMSRAGREPGYKKTNQDNCFAFEKYIAKDQSMFGAMDGHGPNGGCSLLESSRMYLSWAVSPVGLAL